jgi:hypothetical protein
MRANSFTRAPICLIQWGSIEETDELNAIVSAITNEFPTKQLSVPHISTVRISEPTPSAFLDGVRGFLRAHANLQTVYISAHGLQNGLSFDGTEVPVSHQELGEAIRLGTLHRHGLTLVLGCCYAFAPMSQLRTNLPKSIAYVYGFEATPHASDVANLMVPVLTDEQRLYHGLAAVDVAPGGDFVQQYQDALSKVLDDHLGDPAARVQNADGLAVGMYHQDAPGRWTGRAIRLR